LSDWTFKLNDSEFAAPFEVMGMPARVGPDVDAVELILAAIKTVGPQDVQSSEFIVDGSYLVMGKTWFISTADYARLAAMTEPKETS
jgi:hypothetical protein